VSVWIAVGVLVAVALGVVGAIDRLRADLEKRLNRLDARLVRIEPAALRDYADRIARLEERMRQ
jgi:hypothetical protein